MVVALIAGAIALATQRFVLARTDTRARDMHKAELAAKAFGDFFAVIGRLRTLKGAIDNGTPDTRDLCWATEYVRAIDDLHAARGRLAAVASPEIVEKLAALERSPVGMSASTPEGQRVLAEVLELLRADLGVDGGVDFDDLQTLLF